MNECKRPGGFGAPGTWIPSSEPIVYRDGTSLLGIVECIKRGLCQVQDDFNAAIATLNQISDDNRAEYAAFVAQVDDTLTDMRNELVALIKDMQASGAVDNPVHGRDDSVSSAMGDVYDNTRYYALFSVDYDAMELTALEYDDVGTTARRYDLQASRRLNPCVGDYQGREDFWATLPALPEEPARDIYATKTYVSDNYMPLNPTADNFNAKD